jgi:hypothetical protein
MVASAHEVTAKARAHAWVATGVVGLLAACAGNRAPEPGEWRGYRALLAEGGPVQALVAAPDRPLDLAAVGVLVVVADTASPAAPWTAAQGEQVLQFVRGGGKLLVLGGAAGLVATLGIEPERPEHETFRWGFDRRTRSGHAELGFLVVSGRAPELFDGLGELPGHEQVFVVAGGMPCEAALATWSIGAPQRGEVLARLCRRLDGGTPDSGAPVVVRWQAGRGTVLASGLLPDLGHADAAVRDNARAFVRAAAGALRGPSRQPLALCVLGDAGASPAAPAVVPDDGGPRVPLLAHWGWQVPPVPRDAGDARRSAEELVQEVLLPSWCAGADLLELDLGDHGQGGPLAWRRDDPLRPPPAWHAPASPPAWPVTAHAWLAREAHARGMLVHGALDPLPVDPRAQERLVALRFLARELGDVRRLGNGAFDGFAVGGWWRDRAGHGVAMLQDFQPAARLVLRGEAVADGAFGLRGLDADDGAPAGVALPGLSGSWRDGFPAVRFPVGVLDAGAEGTTPDWLVAQANDFVRSRRGLPAALWWRSGPAGGLDSEVAAYASGLAQEPLRAAVAVGLAATGVGGRRDAAAAAFGVQQPGFGAEEALPSAVHVLQNNWFRLAGSSGALHFDAAGTADFRRTAPLVVSPSFLRSRLFGGRPDGSELRNENVDLLELGRRGEGGYGASVAVGGARVGDRQVPAVLAFDSAPRWPREVLVELHASVGYHELELQLRGVHGAGVLAVALDGAELRCLPFRAGEVGSAVTVPLHVAASPPRTLRLAVHLGGAVAFDRLRVVRRGDVAAEADVVVPAGSVARLRERSASTYHAERVELSTVADWPGFVASFACERAVRNLQVERTFTLPAYRELAAGDPAAASREPFVLRAPGTGLPDLIVAPLQMLRHETLRFQPGALVLRSAPESGATTRLGFLLCDPRLGPTLRTAAAGMLAANHEPVDFDLGDRGELTLVGELPVHWTQVVHLRQNARTPYLVQERGWWTWRGAQRSPSGGDWLRVHHAPDACVQVVGGVAVLARTRPGPGSMHCVALSAVESLAATVRVLQAPVLAAPSVVFAADFDEVFVDGRAWAWFDGRTVFLPSAPGTYRVVARSHRGGPAPHVRSTRAPLLACQFAPDRGELVLVVGSEAGRPPELPFTAILAGPVPERVENGELVDEATLRHVDSEAAAAARAGGVVLRCRTGVVKVKYGQKP